jgi:TATA-box binding protein (TBP) (component of TFIID and TFIIIB)
MKVEVVNVVVKMKLPGKADLIKLTGAVPNSRYNPQNFPAAVVKDYEHDRERLSFLVFQSGAVVCTGGKDPERAKKAAKAFAKALMEKGVPGMLIRMGKKAVLVFHSGKGIVAGARSIEEAEAIARDVEERVRRAVTVEQPHQG